MHFQILGPLRVTTGDQREIALGGAKPAAVLAMLLLRPNELVTSDRLIEDLWEGEPPATAAKTLQVHISRLRRALGEDGNGDSDGIIATTAGGYMLRVAHDQVDALRFESLVSEGQAALAEGAHARASARLRGALALWRGEALHDFAYASFTQDAIARLEGLRTVASESAVEAELALGRHAELVPELKALVKRHPLSERLRAQLMLALYRGGRQAEALGVYRATRRLLVDQLGIEPSAELRELERAILAHDSALAAPSAQVPPRRESAMKSSRGALVGYEGELGALEDALESALSGQGRVALLAGEPGVGKTRLADELAAVAETRGAQVVWGRCSTGAGAPAFWAWTQVLRALVADRDALTVRADLSGAAAELMQLLPELRDVVPEVAAVQGGDADDVRFRLFDATARFLARAAASRPLVIVIDDLHAADHSTRALLEFLAPAVLDARVLIVGTYRDTEADVALSATLTELARATDCLQLVLTGLSGDDTAHFVELSARVAPLPVLSEAIHETTSGNPLFVSELVRLLASEDRLHELELDESLALPRGVEQVIARRLDRLSTASRDALSTAAVIGRDFDLALLARVTGTPGDELLGHLHDALAVRVIEPATSGARAFRFSHDLIRQTLHASLAPAIRCRLHEAVGVALEQLHHAGPHRVAAELAHHFSEALPAGDRAKAIEYLTLAGDQAAALSASRDAAEYYTRAVEIAKLDGAEPELLCELSVRLAEQFVLVPDLERAKAPIGEALALASIVPNRIRDARLAVAGAHLALLDTSSFDEDTVFDAIELFEAMDDHANAARAWSAVSFVNCGMSERSQGVQAVERMLECAKHAGSQALMNAARRHLASLLAVGAVPAPQALVRIGEFLDETTDAHTRARLLTALGCITGKLGRFDEARALIGQARETVPRRDRVTFEAYVGVYWARLEYLAGNMQRCEELARAACTDMSSQGLVRFLSSELTILADPLIALGHLDEAAVHLDRAASFTAPDDVDALARQARSRARLALAHGDLEAAETAARAAVAHVQSAYAPDEHAECLFVLADVLFAADRRAEANDVLVDALRIAEAQEHVVFMQRARELLGVAQPVAAA